METRLLIVPVSESIGTVSSILTSPDNMKALVVLAHGAGAGMNHSFMEVLATRLAAHDIGTFRFNFPFVEQGKKRPDVPAIAEKTIAAALAKAKEITVGVPIFAAGKSFGGRMTSHYLSKATSPDCKGVIFYGFPLHPAGKPAVNRAAHLSTVQTPMLFLQGTRDALAEIALIREVCSKLPLAKLVTFEGADHSFKQGKKDFIEELATETDAWITSF
jgi:uncharacterized protein